MAGGSFGGGSSGGSGSGMLGGLMSMIPGLGGLGGILGGLGGLFGASHGLNQARGDIQGLLQNDPSNFSGAGGKLLAGNNQLNFQLPPELQFLSQMGAGVGAQGFAGGMFNNPAFQSAFQGNDIAGAMQQAQGVGNFGANPLAAMGFQALQGAQDQSGLINSTFQNLQNLANPLENEQANRLLNSQFSRLGGGDASPLADERAQQANRFLTAADQRALNASQFGLQNQQTQRAFGTQAIGQGFNQALTSGQSRLQNAMGLFGLGNDVRNQGIQQGFQAQQGAQQNMLAALQAILGSQNAMANNNQATGMHAQALGQLGQSKGGLLGGLGNAIGGFFS